MVSRRRIIGGSVFLWLGITLPAFALPLVPLPVISTGVPCPWALARVGESAERTPRVPESLNGLVPDQVDAGKRVKGFSDELALPTKVREILDPLQTAHYGEGKGPKDHVPPELRDKVIPFFDGYDLLNAYAVLKKGGKDLTPEQKELLMEIIAKRAYGQYGGEWWGAIPKALKEAGLTVTTKDIDHAITEVTTVSARPGIRVMVPHPKPEPKSAFAALTKGGKTPTPKQAELLMEILKKRFGKPDAEYWETVPQKLKDAGLEITAKDIDHTIAELKRNYIDPEGVPNGPLRIVRGNPALSAETAKAERARAEKLLKLPEGKKGKKTTDGVLFISDIHAGRPGGEEANFLAALDVLAKNQPKMLVIGGDLIDAPNFNKKFDELLTGYEWNRDGTQGNKLSLEEIAKREKSLSRFEAAELMAIRTGRLMNSLTLGFVRGGSSKSGERMSAAEIEALRDARFDRYAKLMREKLPDTDIRFQLGNHDLPRLGSLPVKPGVTSVKVPELGGVTIDAALMPKVPLEEGRLKGENWHKEFREQLAANLESKGGDLSKKVREMPEGDLMNVMKEFYQLKGNNFGELHEFSYYNEAAGERVQKILAKHGIKPIGKRSDKYFELDIPNPDWKPGDALAKQSTKVLLVHEPQEKGPNANRIWKDKAVISGGRTEWPPGTRVVIAFDQHTAGSVQFEFEGHPVDYHIVGSMTPNSNAGQTLMAAVLDPRGLGDAGEGHGNVYHVTFNDGKGGVGDLQYAEPKQLQYVDPPPATGNEPKATGSTTAPVRK